MKKRILIGISGGIAAIKIPDLILHLKKKNIDVQVVMTYAATRMLHPRTIEKITGEKVYINLFDQDINTQVVLKQRKVDHIQMAKKANLFIIAPATANSIAKIAQGIADDYLTTTVLAATCPCIIFPSMNIHMWRNPITQKNVAILRSIGYHIVDPDEGLLACGDRGEGRLPSKEVMIRYIDEQLKKQSVFNNKTILITSGGTKEYIDDVRFITNKSSGKMGAALAESCFLRDGNVIYIHSKEAVKPRFAVKEIVFDTAEDLEDILAKKVPKADYLFHVAAVSDFKIKKESGKLASEKAHILSLSPRQKILYKVKTWNPTIFLVGFKAASHVSKEKLFLLAKEKMKTAAADIIVANDVSKANQGFETDTNAVVLVNKKLQKKYTAVSTKKIIAEQILDFILHP
jgi:phosphopantothenoylcysteine decarboxylase/phosphopantothenate--cysteine ligase